MAVFKTSAIITKSSPYRDHDKLLTLFTLGRGKLRALCKRSRHTLNRWSSSFEPPLLCNIQLYEKNQYYTLTEITVEEPFLFLSQSLRNVLAVQSMSYIIDHFTVLEMEQDSLFYLLLSVLHVLEYKECSAFFGSYYFALQFLKESGFALQFQSCSECHSSLVNQRFSFSLQKNSFFCEKCTLDHHLYPRFDASLLTQLESLYYGSLNEMKGKQKELSLFNYSEIDRIMKELYKGFLSKECLTINHFEKFS